MAKQKKLEFDYEEYFDSLFENTAVLMWSTHIEPHTFAFHLNKLYDMRLERRDNIIINPKSGTLECSVLSYQDNVMHNAFFLVSNDTPPSPSRRNSIFFDKTLLIMGPDAFETAENIFNDLDPSNPVENSDNLSRHDRLRQAFIWAGILETASFDFSDPERPTTSYFHGPATNSKSLGLRSKFLKEQREYVSDLFLALDNLMPDYDE